MSTLIIPVLVNIQWSVVESIGGDHLVVDSSVQSIAQKNRCSNDLAKVVKRSRISLLLITQTIVMFPLFRQIERQKKKKTKRQNCSLT